ncbi:hypothetical protein TrVFT333_009258 [Trichoderma virens FT-333]|nr:hypothetical protein TrVFT333_009258 [Trichoderma virens FT-333]
MVPIRQKLKIATAQVHTIGNPERALQILETKVRKLSSEHVDLVLFPEVFIGGFPRLSTFGNSAVGAFGEEKDYGPYMNHWRASVDLGDTPMGYGQKWARPFEQMEWYEEEGISSSLTFDIDVTAPGILPVVSASMGEAVHLTPRERIKLIQTLRNALDSIELQNTPIVAGVGGNSTRETIQLARDAAAAGADFALVIAPGYWAGYLKGNPAATKRFFVDVAAGSPIPVVIYNFPPVAAGIDLESDDVAEIARLAPNICGIMLSCGNVGKLARVAALLEGTSFTTLAGLIDFLLPSVVVGSAGAISPLPNIAPVGKIKADLEAAQKVQGIASLAESALLKSGVPGLKGLMSKQFGYPATPRLPLLAQSDVATLSQNKYIINVLALEKTS